MHATLPISCGTVGGRSSGSLLTLVLPTTPALLCFSGRQAKANAIALGVPVTPATKGAVSSLAEATAVGHAIGYPVMVKADCGGGGRGMRMVANDEDLEEALSRWALHTPPTPHCRVWLELVRARVLCWERSPHLSPERVCACICVHACVGVGSSPGAAPCPLRLSWQPAGLTSLMPAPQRP